MSSRRNKELRWRRGDLPGRGRGNLPRQQVGCCGKKQFATEEAAAEALLRFGSFNSRAEYVPVRVYRCYRGWWHLTSKPGDGSVPGS